jgi:hypothetical protein
VEIINALVEQDPELRTDAAQRAASLGSDLIARSAIN